MLRIAAKLLSHKHLPQTLLTNQPTGSTNEAFLRVQNDVPQPQSNIKDDDKLATPPGAGDNNKGIPNVSVSKLPDFVQTDTTNQR